MTTAITELREYLGLMVRSRMSMQGLKDFPYSCMEDFVLRHGKVYQPAVPPRNFRRMTIKHCRG